MKLRWKDLRIRANRLILANRFRVPELNPFFCKSCFVGAKNCESQVSGDSRESLARYEKSFFFFYRESIRAIRPDSLCESPAHLRYENSRDLVKLALLQEETNFWQKSCMKLWL